ncbi:hypothetical protein GE09DRAFT_1226745 [Coniochaeta sp. 2T2.1]|nr:hypothetical protein GE09DRAFT_1226745 [Coniochaeta sp. 2T2.1]
MLTLRLAACPIICVSGRPHTSDSQLPHRVFNFTQTSSTLTDSQPQSNKAPAAIMCKEKHTNLACGCTEFSGILNCPSLFKGCMGPRGEQDRVYEETDQPCDLCRNNGWRPSSDNKGKAVDNTSGSGFGSNANISERKDPDQRPAKRKRVDD